MSIVSYIIISSVIYLIHHIYRTLNNRKLKRQQEQLQSKTGIPKNGFGDTGLNLHGNTSTPFEQ